MKFEEQSQLQLVERKDIEEEDELFEVIDKLIAQGINAGDVKKLQDAGIYTCNGLMMHTKKNLTGIKGLSEAKVDKICEAAEKIVNFGYVTGSDALTKRKSIVKITTGSQAIDEPLGAPFRAPMFAVVSLALLTTCQAATTSLAASPICPPSAAAESPVSPSTLLRTHQPHEGITFQIVELAMKYGLPTIGAVVVLSLIYHLYKSYPNTFRFLSIYGFMHYLGFGSASVTSAAYPVRANPSLIVGIISAGGGLILTFVRWVARRPSGAIAATDTVGPQPDIGDSMGLLMAVAFVGTFVASAAFAGGPWMMERARAAARGSLRAGATAYGFLTSPFRRAATDDFIDLELQPILTQSRRVTLSPQLIPTNVGLAQLLD